MVTIVWGATKKLISQIPFATRSGATWIHDVFIIINNVVHSLQSQFETKANWNNCRETRHNDSTERNLCRRAWREVQEISLLMILVVLPQFTSMLLHSWAASGRPPSCKHSSEKIKKSWYLCCYVLLWIERKLQDISVKWRIMNTQFPIRSDVLPWRDLPVQLQRFYRR